MKQKRARIALGTKERGCLRKGRVADEMGWQRHVVRVQYIRIVAETMGSRKERYELVLDGGGAQGTTGEETLLALGTRLANKEIRVSAILLRYGNQIPVIWKLARGARI